MDDNPETIPERDSLNQELDSLECHLDQRLQPPPKQHKLLHIFLLFLKCLFYLCILKKETKQNKICTIRIQKQKYTGWGDSERMLQKKK